MTFCYNSMNWLRWHVKTCTPLTRGTLMWSCFICSETLKWRHGTILFKKFIPIKAWVWNWKDDSEVIRKQYSWRIPFWFLTSNNSLILQLQGIQWHFPISTGMCTHVHVMQHWHTCVHSYDFKYILKKRV